MYRYYIGWTRTAVPANGQIIVGGTEVRRQHPVGSLSDVLQIQDFLRREYSDPTLMVQAVSLFAQ